MGISLWTTIYNALPDFSGIMLAACGLALVVYPEAIKRIEDRRRVRWTLASILVLLGGAGMRSSFVQHRENDKKQDELSAGVKILDITVEALQATIKTYGPKLDALIAHPQSMEQRALAVALRNDLRPKIQVDEPSYVGFTPNLLFNVTLSNVGGSIAKGVDETSVAKIGPRGKGYENELFGYLHSHENDADVKPADVFPGYEGRHTIPVAGDPPVTRTDVANKKSGDVVYLAVLVSFFDEAGRQYHTEKCMYLQRGIVTMYCDSHNISY